MLLPFAPLGPPALHPDGRAFLVGAGGNLLSVAGDGQLLWSRRLPGAAWQGQRPVPVLLQGLLLLAGGGQAHGYSLGGELRFSLTGALTGPPFTDGQRRFYLIDEAGVLLGFDSEGRALLRVDLGLRLGLLQGRGVVLPDGRLLLSGADAQARDGGAAVLCSADGQVEARLRLPTAPVGLAVSQRAGEVALLGVGAEVLGLGPRGEIVRRLSLPGPAVADPVPGEGDEVAVLVEKGGRWLVQVGARQSETSLGAVVPALVRGGNGRLYAPFLLPGGLLPDHAGVISLGPDLWRQPLPGPASSLTRAPGTGAVVATVAGELYLWIFEP